MLLTFIKYSLRWLIYNIGYLFVKYKNYFENLSIKKYNQIFLSYIILYIFFYYVKFLVFLLDFFIWLHYLIIPSNYIVIKDWWIELSSEKKKKVYKKIINFICLNILIVTVLHFISFKLIYIILIYNFIKIFWQSFNFNFFKNNTINTGFKLTRKYFVKKNKKLLNKLIYNIKKYLIKNHEKIKNKSKV